jgi:DNA-binding response OmpR family regulator
MGDSAATRVTTFAAPLRRRVRRSESAPTTAQPCTLEARIDASASASARILRALHGGCGTFVLTAVDGQMSARIQLTITNAAAAETNYKVGSARVTVDWSRSTVANGARRVSLSRTELRLLSALLAGEGRPIARVSLISQVWPEDALPDADRENALAVYMCSLRKRLTSIGAGDALQTVRGVGYRAVL